ncbi:hypothetical protein ACTXNW_18445 [Enterococcus malodoratus]|uniref:hypothetical protein n=1 Tax=Enterococcus malodoratus TaxID=71451 RepID=UPI003FD643F5
MDNIIFKKVWEDENFIEIKITAISKFSTSYQTCYIDESSLERLMSKLYSYLNDYTQNSYIEFGDKKGNYTPAFSMELMGADVRGHVKIEVDIEIDDVDDRSHRCKYFVESELGAIERFSQKAFDFYGSQIGTSIAMFER